MKGREKMKKKILVGIGVWVAAILLSFNILSANAVTAKEGQDVRR